MYKLSNQQVATNTGEIVLHDIVCVSIVGDIEIGVILWINNYWIVARPVNSSAWNIIPKSLLDEVQCIVELLKFQQVPSYVERFRNGNGT